MIYRYGEVAYTHDPWLPRDTESYELGATQV